ncbi:MAG: MFS transporter [Candidatus Thorarchaeota archaeon]|nr:MFS transporter [Candidatus Thorarchaeota archaeon]
MSKVASFFGLADANEKILRLSSILSLILPIVAFATTLSTTFFMIFVAEWLGGGSYIEGLSLVGILVVLQMGVQTILDYPTAALGDAIGQKWIITSSFLTFAATYYMVAFVGPETSFLYVIVLYLLMGFGNSQMSGAFMAWFDNNYRVAMPADNDRKQYGIFMGKVGMLFQIFAVIALIPGSILAVVFGRAWVFQLQAILCLGIALLGLRYMDDFPEVKESRIKKPSMKDYTSVLSSGVKFLFSDKYVTYIILGGCVVMSAGMVWGNLILFPMYFSYLLTDIAVSTFRTLLFGVDVINQERSGVWSRRFEPKKWIPRFRFLQSVGAVFYLSFAAIMFFFPPVTQDTEIFTLTIPYTQIVIMQLPTSSIVPLLLMTITFIITGFAAGFAEILTQRELLDVIPNKIRNSMYSLSPTIATILAMPQIAFFGWLIPTAGFSLTMTLCAAISILGVLMIAKGLSHPKPLAKDISHDVQNDEMTIEVVAVEE